MDKHEANAALLVVGLWEGDLPIPPAAVKLVAHVLRDAEAEAKWLDEQIADARSIAMGAMNASPIEQAEALRAVVSRLQGTART